MYDFILFENFYLARNHYKDVSLIAELLKANGYTVAIADVFGERENCIVEGVPHIRFQRKCPIDINKIFSCKTKIIGAIINFVDKKRIGRYMSYIMRQLKGRYHHLYAGSYFTYMTTGWLKEIPASSCAFFWGLRSARLTENSRSAIRLRQYFDSHSNLKFFISDEIIFNEFLQLGIRANRLVIRPERTIKELPIIKRKSLGTLRLLTIGSLRPQKRIEMCLDALKAIGDTKVEYTIAGKTNTVEYENTIANHSRRLHNVKRYNYRIPEDEYDRLFEENDFLVLCDQRQESSITNGTMNEALLKGMPIIAPNYNPYKYFIEKYEIGILFEVDDIGTLVSAIKEALQKGPNYFEDSIKRYQATLLFDTVSVNFGKSLAEAIS